MEPVGYNEHIRMNEYANKFKRCVPVPHWDYIQMFLVTLRCVEQYSNGSNTHGIKRF